MVDLAQVLPAGALGAVGMFGGKAFMQWLSGREGATQARIAADVELTKHQDALTADVIAMARNQLATARAEIAQLYDLVEKLRPMEAHFYELEQALDHLDACLNATPEERPSIERAARAFVKRIRRKDEARGTVNNEIQRTLSGLNVLGDQQEAQIRAAPDLPPKD